MWLFYGIRWFASEPVETKVQENEICCDYKLAWGTSRSNSQKWIDINIGPF